jgi:prephenate dehydrogenase
MKKVIIVGAGGHGKVIADIIRLNGDIVFGYLDDKNPEMLPGFPVLGEVDSIRKFALEDYCFFVAIGN